MEKVFRGVKFDKKLKASLKRLDDASKIFSMAVVSNQQSIMTRVDKYVHAMSNDVLDLQAVQTNNLYQDDQRIAAHVNDYIKTTEKNMTSLAETARLIIKQGNQLSQEQGIAPRANPASVYLFLDGLDENKHSHAAEDILKLFESVDEEPSILRKTWISSRETNVLNIHLRQWPMVNVDKHAEVDVKDFLTRMVPKLERSGDNVQDVEGKPLDEWVLQKLQAKAESNFLYARLMVEWLKEDVFTIDDVITFIKSRVPNNIAEMYKRIFRQYQKDQHRYISAKYWDRHLEDVEPTQERREELLKFLQSPNFQTLIQVQSLNIDLQSNAGSSIAFSNAVATVLSNMKDYGSKLILSHGTRSNLEPLSTDVAMRDGIIVVASRNVHRHLKEKSAKGKAGRKHTTKLLQDLDSDSSETGSDEDSEDEYSADENSAYETCSDGSTDFDSDESEEEITGDDMDSDEQSDESLDNDTDEEESEIEPADGEAEAEVDQRQKRKQRLVANYQMPAESNLELEGDLLKQEQKDRPTYPGMPSRVRDPKDRITATIAVYDMASGDAVRLFHYDHDTPVTCMLYHSPPVLHPKKALVVWPLGGGEVLFADFEEKTYFIRAIMPTTRDS
ncbi:hypothetical protein KHU50_010634 [Colletotrichum sp. SAR 10_65]|nr:hypothetical protein KHU50_010634 [Colletotrichum sp. SAR 10_65]